MFEDLIQRVGLENYVLGESTLTYSREAEDFSITGKDVTFSTHKPLEARHAFHQICQVYPRNFFIQTFRYNLRATPIPELSAIENSEADKIVIITKYSPKDVPNLVEMLQAYFSQCPE